MGQIIGKRGAKENKDLGQTYRCVTKMAEQAFEMSCSMKLHWSRWSARPGEMVEEVIDTDMIFAVRQQNICTIPKVISLLGKMRVVVALLPKKTPRQSSRCGE